MKLVATVVAVFVVVLAGLAVPAGAQPEGAVGSGESTPIPVDREQGAPPAEGQYLDGSGRLPDGEVPGSVRIFVYRA